MQQRDIGNFTGRLISFQDLELHAKGKLSNHKGLAESKRGKVICHLEGTLENKHGHLASECLMDICSGIFENDHGSVESRTDELKLKTTGFLKNYYGQFFAKQKLVADISGDIQNSNGLLKSEKDITIKAASLYNRTAASNRTKATIDGKDLDITAIDNIECSSCSQFKAQRKLTLSAATLAQRAALISRYVYIKVTKGLTFTAPQSVETLNIDLKNVPFTYEENQLQASKVLSIKTNKELDLKVPLKVKGELEITAYKIYNNTILAADHSITLTTTSTWSVFPVWNIETIVSNKGNITINSQGLRHGSGKIACEGNFIFNGKTVQLLYPLHVGGDTHLHVPDQEDIDAKKCELGNRSYINYSQLFVKGLLHLTLPNHFITFPRDFKTSGSLLLEKEGHGMNGFRIYYDLIASKGIKVKMPKENVQVGWEEVDAVKMQSKEGKIEIDAYSMDIIKAKIYAKGLLLVPVALQLKLRLQQNPHNQTSS